MKKALSLVLALVMVFALVACGGNNSSGSNTSTANTGTSTAPAPAPSADNTDTSGVANDPKVTLVYAEVNPADSIIGQVAMAFKEKAEELSGGSITIDVQPSGVLGNENDVLDAMLGGSTNIDICRISAFTLTNYGTQKTKLLSIPFTFESRQHYWNFAMSDLAPDFLNEPQTLGLPVRGLFYGEEGFRHFFTRKEISGIDDLKGMKLRVSVDPIMTGMVEGLGASPTVVNFGELYSALNSGVCDGAEQPIGNYKSNAFDEVAPNLILDGHTVGAVEELINDNGWNKLTEAQQAVLMEAAKYAQEHNAQIVEAAEQEVLDGLKAEGVNVIEVPDKAPWQAACEKVISENTSDQAELYQQILNLK